MKKLLKRFIALESSSSIILFLATFTALVMANSRYSGLYFQLTEANQYFINEGLMAIFFLLVGVQLKRGFVAGEMSRLSQIGLPLFAAAGGMLLPGLIYLLINSDDTHLIHGWATPVATDIAFAVGVLSLFGKRVPYSLNLFLLALAIFDDVGAIIIIALFYSSGLVFQFVFAAIFFIIILGILNILSVRSLWLYLLMGLGLWFCMLKSGIHPTISGVITGLLIPHQHSSSSPLDRLEWMINPWVSFLIMPLFAFANAGFSLAGLSKNLVTSGLVLGIVFGLFIGKQLGVFGFSWLLIRLGGGKLPSKTTWLELYGVSILCGIGFTMSLFLGTLSFHNENIYLTTMRLGVIAGSLLSGIVGALVLHIAFTRNRQHRSSVLE